jgi:tetratricopeptide (TPR) repeat protein
VRKISPYFILALLAASCFSLATMVQPYALAWSQRGQDSILKVLLGDGRRLFANHFFTKADIYFHSGYYPSIFDRREPLKESHMSGHESHEDEAHEKEADFLGRPGDWLEGFGRHFMITDHTHLEHGQAREILPWLKLSSELDPQLIETYTVAAYWLANQLHKVPEAQQFLREGLRANPNNYEILFSLGRLYYENDHDPIRARNVWELALRRWNEQERGKKEPDNLAFEEITVNLSRLEEDLGNLVGAIEYLEQAKKVSPSAGVLQRQIDDMKQKLPAATHPSGRAP